MAKITRAGMKKWIDDLEETLDAKEEAAGNEEDKDYVNEERLEKLNEEARLLQDIMDAVQEYIDLE